MASNLQDIKRRIKSVESTRQITKAMELVASSKLRKARDKAVVSQPYFEIMYETMMKIAENNKDFSSIYTKSAKGSVGKLWVVIAGDRGLAAGYNSNVFKMATSQIDKENDKVVAVGKKAIDFFTKRGYDVVYTEVSSEDHLSDSDYQVLERKVRHQFSRGYVREVYVIYTNFISNMVFEPATLRILPISVPTGMAKGTAVEYDPSPEVVFDSIVRMYVGGMLRGAIVESYASELGSRRNAMESATDNADEIIKNLDLEYNRARQGAITQEITEIVAGARSAE